MQICWEKNVNLDQWWNNNKYRYECRKLYVCEKYYVRNPTT